jgi:sigma54-dependent transcription regulator
MIALIMLFSLSLGWSANFQFFRVGETKVAFHQVDGAWVNKNCSDLKCMALKASKHNLTPVKSQDLLGGKNPRAVQCKKQLKGEVVIALDRNGNQQSLCHFSDDSYLK